MDTYESVILVKNEVFVFKIPPRTSNRGYRAADWNLQEPQWTGRMRLVVKNNELVMKLEDKASGELFAKSPIETYPGVALESVTDSSRYFVVRVQDDNGRAAFIGIGFGDRSDSFDLNVALQDHFKWLRKEKQGDDGKPQQEMDFSFKEGETIKINMKITKKGDGESSRVKPRSVAGAGGGLLPPPPGARFPPPPSPQHATAPPVPSVPDAPSAPTNTADWGDFSSAGGPPTGQHQNTTTNSNWVQF